MTRQRGIVVTLAVTLVLPLRPALGGPEDKVMKEAGETIRNEKSQISESTIKRDIATIRGAEDQITPILKKKGIGKQEDVAESVVTTWKLIRLGPKAIGADKSLGKDLLLKAIEESELLYIESEPVGAELFVDKVKLRNKSDTKAYVSRGEHVIRAKKGAMAAEETYTVREDKTNRVHLILK
jgi:hypothetical protein